MPFASMTYEDKVAFFELLDEYFETRPHLSGSQSNPTIIPTSTRNNNNNVSPTNSTSSSSRTLPPMAPPHTSSSSSRTYAQTSPTSPSTSTPPPQSNSSSLTSAFPGLASFSNGGMVNAQSGKPDMATKIMMGSLKMGASGARSGINMLSKNPAAMDALGKVGAKAMIQGAHASVNRASGTTGQPEQQHQQEQQQNFSPPPSAAYVPGRGRATSGGSGGGGVNAAPPKRNQPQKAVNEPESQATAMYDYDATDDTDLGVQKGQIVNVMQKTSADWWTCEDGNGQRGLVPSAYLKEM